MKIPLIGFAILITATAALNAQTTPQSGPIYYVGGTFSAPSTLPNGNLFLWWPDIGVLRAGSYSSASAIATANFGSNSIALGNNPTANSANGVAIGSYVVTSGVSGVSIGSIAKASGVNSIALGFNAISSGSGSVCIGGGVASGQGAVAVATGAAVGNYSSAIGTSSAFGDYSASLGQSESDGYSSFTAGICTARSYGGSAVGILNFGAKKNGGSPDPNVSDPLDPIFEIGNGSDVVGVDGDAFTVFRDGTTVIAGNVGYATSAPAGSLIVPGNVGIGTGNPDATAKLTVNGRIHAKEVIVDAAISATDLKVRPEKWADDVFAPNHALPALSSVEASIRKDGHLPGIPSASDVAANGVSVGDMQAKLLAKIEELTLHQIEQEKRFVEQQQRIERLEAENAALRLH